MTEPASLWVVDDDRSIRFVLAAALTEAGYRVTAFASADEALAALAAPDSGRMPKLVLADVRMPGMDGLGLLDQLKAKLPQLPVIIMSAHTDIASTAGAFRGGAQDFLSKPFDLDAAVELVGRCLPQGAAGLDAQGRGKRAILAHAGHDDFDIVARGLPRHEKRRGRVPTGQFLQVLPPFAVRDGPSEHARLDVARVALRVLLLDFLGKAGRAAVFHRRRFALEPAAKFFG